MVESAPQDGAGGLPDGLLVPDDARDLEPDRLAWLALERTRRRRARLRRLVLTRRWERFGLSGPVVVLCLLVTAGVGALAVVFVPRPATAPPGPAPLSSVAALTVPTLPSTTGPPPISVPAVEGPDGGRLGRRLPEVALDADLAGVRSPDLRPAVILLVPADCRCEAAVTAVYRQAREFRLATWLVAAGSASATAAGLVHLDESAAAGGARWALDADAALARALAARGLTLALVRADGVLTGLLRDVPLDPRAIPALELALSALPSLPAGH
jgi:hypothetical protein